MTAGGTEATEDASVALVMPTHGAAPVSVHP